jgi:hypothetical protein
MLGLTCFRVFLVLHRESESNYGCNDWSSYEHGKVSQKGPAICDSEGVQLTTRVLNARFVECLCDIFDEKPELFLANIPNYGDIEMWYNVFRSLRRGSNSRALSQGISDSCTSIINRWHLKEKAKGKMPSFTNMP